MKATTARAQAPSADTTIRLNGAGDHRPEKIDPEALALALMRQGKPDDEVRADLRKRVAAGVMRIGDMPDLTKLREKLSRKGGKSAKASPRTKTASGKVTHQTTQTHQPEGGQDAATPPDRAPEGVVDGGFGAFGGFVQPAPLVCVTVIENAHGPVAKRFWLDEDDNLQRSTKASVYEGTARVVSVEGVKGLLHLIDGLKPSQALAYGVIATGATEAPVVTQEDLKRGGHPGAIARDRDHLHLPAGRPAVFFQDYDPRPGAPVLGVDDLDAILSEAVPGWNATTRAYRASSSSFIRTKGGRVLIGSAGWRVYAVVDDGAAIPDVGDYIQQRLWDLGHGYIAISKSGQKLARTPFDGSVHQPERLDFVAGPHLSDDLERFAPPAVIKPGKPMLTTADLHPELTMEQWRQTNLALKTAKRKAEGEASEARKVFVADRMAVLAKGGMTKARQRHLRAVLTRAAERRILSGDFLLVCPDGAAVTVADLLADPDKWIGARFADPLEPDYRNDRRIAACLRGDDGKLYIYSHAHGGLRYSLVRESAEIHLTAGEQPRVVDEALAVLRGKGEVFERGGELVRLDDTGIAPVSDEWILDYLGRNVVFSATRMKDKEPKPARVDAPPWLARRISAKRGERGLRELHAVITAPTMRPDGSLLTEPGYDEATGLLLKPGKWPSIPEQPTEAQLRQALDTLWRPFSEFPFVDAVARGIWLATLLTALIRQSLTLAPGTSVDAPEAATGKTLLGKCALALMGAPPTVVPECRDEEELRKRLLSALRTGSAGILFDNIRGVFGSAAIEAMLTAEFYSDRVLGASQMMSLPTVLLVLFSGNNFRPSGDLWRRILTCRIDAKTDAPERRSFTLEPLVYCREHRQELVAAGLTLLRGFVVAGKPRTTPDKLASFEQWDSLVRQCVIWIGTKKLMADIVQLDGDPEPFFADPAEAITRAKESEPDRQTLSAFLTAVRTLKGDKSWSTKDLTAAIEDEKISAVMRDDLRSVLVDISDDRAGKLNDRKIGRWITSKVDRRIAGVRIVKVGIRAGRNHWAIALDQPPSAIQQEVGETNSPTSPNSPPEFEPGAWEDEETETWAATGANGEFDEFGEFLPPGQIEEPEHS